MDTEPLTLSSTPTSGVSSKQKDKVFLIGYMSHQIIGSKLPPNRQVSRSLVYNKRQVKLETRDAAELTIQNVILFWEKAEIPTKHLKKLYCESWKTHLKKSIFRVRSMKKPNIFRYVRLSNKLWKWKIEARNILYKTKPKTRS